MAQAKIMTISPEKDSGDLPSVELAKHQASRELIFGIVGHVGSGTSTIAEKLADILEEQVVDDFKQSAVILKARSVIEFWAKSNSEQLPNSGDPMMAQVERFQDLGT